MQHDKLKIVLEKHAEWRNNPANGERARLQGAILYGVNLKGANLHGADLQGADLQDANLKGANLHGADLQGADLQGAILYGADLQDADLQDANLQGARLQWARLQWARLEGANLEGSHINHCVGNMCEIRSLQLDTWAIAFTADTMAIGCKQHAIGDWWAFDDERIARMDRQALTWWRTWKPILQQIVAATESPDSRSQPSDATGT